MDKEQVEYLKRRRIVRKKSGTSETELKTMRRSKIIQSRMRATANETEKEICLSKRRSGDYENRVGRNEKYKKIAYTILWREGSK